MICALHFEKCFCYFLKRFEILKIITIELATYEFAPYRGHFVWWKFLSISIRSRCSKKMNRRTDEQQILEQKNVEQIQVRVPYYSSAVLLFYCSAVLLFCCSSVQSVFHSQGSKLPLSGI